MPTWWRRRERELSAYIDDELETADAECVAERLVFAPRERRRLALWRTVDRAVRTALLPLEPTPDAEAAAALIVEAVEAATPPPPRPASGPRWTPVVVVAGLLVTAGLAVAGFRHRPRS